MSDRALLENLFRRQSGSLVSTLTRIFGAYNIDLAEEVVQDAMIKALEVWPYAGIPENPAGWLVRTAKNRAIDLLRRETRYAGILDDYIRSLPPTAIDAGDESGDDVPGMLFLCCHPAISPEARVALALKTVAGLSIGEIAAAFLAREGTIAQRIVRAKTTIRNKRIPFDLAGAAGDPDRTNSVLETLYLWFNAGYAAHFGESLLRLDLCGEALRLTNTIANHDEISAPETHALLALMSLQAARFPVRTHGHEGEILLLRDQDRSQWDARLIHAGLHHLDLSARGPQITAYHLEAGIAACHATARSYESTDWRRIVEYYDQLFALKRSPVVALNRAVARSRIFGSRQAITEIEALQRHPALAQYLEVPAVLAELHAEIDEAEQAIFYLNRALGFPCAGPRRRYLKRRLRELQSRLDYSRV